MLCACVAIANKSLNEEKRHLRIVITNWRRL